MGSGEVRRVLEAEVEELDEGELSAMVRVDRLTPSTSHYAILSFLSAAPPGARLITLVNQHILQMM